MRYHAKAYGAYITPHSSDAAPSRSVSPRVPPPPQLQLQPLRPVLVPDEASFVGSSPLGLYLVVAPSGVPIARSSSVELPANVVDIFGDEGHP